MCAEEADPAMTSCKGAATRFLSLQPQGFQGALGDPGQQGTATVKDFSITWDKFLAYLCVKTFFKCSKKKKKKKSFSDVCLCV